MNTPEKRLGRAMKHNVMDTAARRVGMVGLLAFGVVSGLAGGWVAASEVWTRADGTVAVDVDGAGKWTSLLSYAPDDPVLFPERWSDVSLLRLRLGLTIRGGEWLHATAAYDFRMRQTSESAGGAGGGILPPETDAPYRLVQLDAELLEIGDTFRCGHELDRAFVAFHPHWGEVLLGRQAIGLGRGVLFGAVDLIAPFSPLEVDREWRRGVDAARIEGRISDAVSAECLGAFGETWEESALLGRVRGYVGRMDAELIAGKRGEDELVGGSLSAAVGDTEMHIELAVFDTPEAQPDGGLFGRAHLVGKGVLGASYTFDVGRGITLLGEYHYSGFGVENIEDAVTRLSDPIFAERYTRGDTQILGRHALAAQFTCPLSDTWTCAILVLESPVDGSGLIAPSLSWDFAQNVSLTASGHVPWGETPSGGQLRSEYGGTARSGFLQIGLYY